MQTRFDKRFTRFSVGVVVLLTLVAQVLRPRLGRRSDAFAALCAESLQSFGGY